MEFGDLDVGQKCISSANTLPTFIIWVMVEDDKQFTKLQEMQLPSTFTFYCEIDGRIRSISCSWINTTILFCLTKGQGLITKNNQSFYLHACSKKENTEISWHYHSLLLNNRCYNLIKGAQACDYKSRFWFGRDICELWHPIHKWVLCKNIEKRIEKAGKVKRGKKPQITLCWKYNFWYWQELSSFCPTTRSDIRESNHTAC